jgi:predicted dehydrogenase
MLRAATALPAIDARIGVIQEKPLATTGVLLNSIL